MSSSRIMAQRRLYTKIIALCLLIAGIGYYMVEFISTKERPILGRTFYIVTGCGLIAVSVIIFCIILQKMFFPKKKHKSKSPPIFLDKDFKSKM